MDSSSKPKNKFNRLLLLIVSSTLIAEVLSGSTTLSRIQYLPIQFILYGTAAILIREVSVRLNAGWLTIILLGLAFGFMLEGLVLQSIFNPNFLGNNLSFGRLWGVNWVWLMYMPAFHAFWAISTPVLICDVYYNDIQPQPWATKTLLGVAAVVLVLICTAFHFLFMKMTHYNTNGFLLIIVAAWVIVLVVTACAFKQMRLGKTTVTLSHPAWYFWTAVLVTLIASALWYAGFATIFISYKPGVWVVIIAAPMIAYTYFALIVKWRPISPTSRINKFGLVCGLLAGGSIFGYFATLSNRTDHYAQLGFMLLILLLLLAFYKRVVKAGATTAVQV